MAQGRADPIMELSGKLTLKDLDDFAHLVPSRSSWARLLLENWHGAALLTAIVWATILGLSGRTNPVWSAMALIWVMIVGCSLWTWHSVRRERAHTLLLLNATLPDVVRLISEGVTWDEPDGSKKLIPWRQLQGWRERRRVIAIDELPNTPAIIVSVANLSEVDRQRLRDLLGAQIPPLALAPARVS